MKRHRVLSILGTRPEGIKMAPVIRAMRARSDRFEHLVVSTGQHRQMLGQVLANFDISPDVDLDLMQPNQQLADFSAAALNSLSFLFRDMRPDLVLLQGDTTTVMSAALAAAYNRVQVGHVEAGLRSFDRKNPFPEEINRRIAGCISDFHFAPTARARDNLLREGVEPKKVFVTGNTIVDALKSIRLQGDFEDPELRSIEFKQHRVLLVTAHRRENQGKELAQICNALRVLTLRFPDIYVVYPVHLNPNVAAPVRQFLRDTERVSLIPPLSYADLLRLMKRCHFVLTDSGGIQEEAPSFNKPVLILRELTERPEIVEAGAGRIVGTDTETIVKTASELLNNREMYQAMSSCENPFGDGHAADRIVAILSDVLN